VMPPPVGYVMDSTLSRVGSRMGLGWFVNAYSSHSIHNVKEVGLQSTKGSFPICKGFGYRVQGDGFASKTGWDHGGSCVALPTITTWTLM
jgi:hypothetical protein